MIDISEGISWRRYLYTKCTIKTRKLGIFRYCGLWAQDLANSQQAKLDKALSEANPVDSCCIGIRGGQRVAKHTLESSSCWERETKKVPQADQCKDDAERQRDKMEAGFG